MAIFRIEKTADYTTMSNRHFKDKRLSLKSKGLLSQMLSLPENWDYTLKGLAHINRESIDAIRTAIWELEKAGYVRAAVAKIIRAAKPEKMSFKAQLMRIDCRNVVLKIEL